MKQPDVQAARWLRQAEHDLSIAERHLKDHCYSDCCFMSEQTAQKALKAYLFAQGERSVFEHSVFRMITRAREHDAAFAALRERGSILDQYYIPTRYPDALAEPAVPFESYTNAQASEALAFAREFVGLVQHKLGISPTSSSTGA